MYPNGHLPTMTTDIKNSFILYKSYYEILKGLPASDMGILFQAILKYQALGEPLEMPANLEIIFKFIKNQFDLDDKKYIEFVAKQSANGKKGGRPKIENKPEPKKTDEEEKNEGEREEISPEDRKILEDYIQEHKLAAKNVRAYANKIIENGDHIAILEEEKKRLAKPKPLTREERIKQEMAEIKDKRSAARVFYRYHAEGSSPPDEFNELMEKYDLDMYDKLYDYLTGLTKAKQRAP